MATPTFPNNWQYGDDGCCTNTISECVPLFNDFLAQENFETITQEDTSEIVLG